MSISKCSLTYEVPSNFEYVRKQTLKNKICRIVKKAIHLLNRNQFAITISLFSFFISKSIASSLEELSDKSNNIKHLQDCQDKICAYWNNTINNEQVTKESRNLLSKLRYRCDTFHSNYSPFKSLKRCMKDWCHYASREGEVLSECVNPLQTLVDTWNNFCPKSEFNRLRRNRRVDYINNCLTKLCKHYKESAEKPIFYFFCSSVEINHLLKKVYNLLNNWKKEYNTTKINNSNLDTTLSITSSVVGIISAFISIIATLIGCTVAKVTLSTIPNVALGLRNIIGATLMYARDTATNTPDDLTIPAQLDRRISQISTHINSIYHDAPSSFSSAELNSFQELQFNFGYQEASVQEESLQIGASLEKEGVEEKMINGVEMETSISKEEFLENYLFSQNIGKSVIETEKNCTDFIDSQNNGSLFQNITDLYQGIRGMTEVGLVNLTQCLIKNSTDFIDSLHNGSLFQNTTDLYQSIKGMAEVGLINLTQFLMKNSTENRAHSEDMDLPNNSTLLSNSHQNIFSDTKEYIVSSTPTPVQKSLWEIFLESYVKPKG